MEIYKELYAADVPYVATVTAGGDLEGGTTRTRGALCARPHAPNRCILFDELARPLEDCENAASGILVASVFHALTAHEDAWVRAQILHRDISCGNVMFVVDQDQETEADLHDIPNGWDSCKHEHDFALEQTQSGRSGTWAFMSGILNDWDLHNHERDFALEQTHSSRSGTWAFMSGVSLQYPLKPYRLSDDLEAFIHVITFCFLRFHLHNKTQSYLRELHKAGNVPEDAELRKINCKNKRLSRYVAEYYDEYNPGLPHDRSTMDWGGTYKTEYVRSGHLVWSFPGDSGPLEALVRSLCMLLQTHYETIDFDALQERYSSSGGGINTALSTIEENISRASDGNAEEGSAVSTDPFTSKPNPGNDLGSHSCIQSTFQLAIESFLDVRVKGLDLNDKTPDQFLGLREWHDNSLA